MPWFLLINYNLVFAAIGVFIALTTVFFLRVIFKIDLDTKLKILFYKVMGKKNTFITPITRTTGNKSLVLLDAGVNKATVIATLRQISGVEQNTAKQLVNAAPQTLIKNISEKEAFYGKQALEFVGAKLEIK